MQEQWQFIDAGCSPHGGLLMSCCCANSDLHMGCRPASTCVLVLDGVQGATPSGSAVSARLLLPPAAGPAAAAVPGVLHSYAYGVLGRYGMLHINRNFEFERKRIHMEATAQFAMDVVAPPAPAHMPQPFAEPAA
jgi:hypothetical protein